MGFDLAGPVDAAEAAESFAKNFNLVLKLAFVGNVLIIAAAAAAEMRARRGDAFARGFEHAIEFGADKFFLAIEGAGIDFFAGQDERDEDGRA